jgi:5-carboxyvanillate decarboxylase
MMTELKTGGAQGYLRIATEEAFAPAEMMDLYAEVLDADDVDPGFESLMGFYMRHKSERATTIFRRLQDLDDGRIADMDARGIDRQVIGITAPGTQVLSRDKAVALSVLANDRLAEACKRHPDRFTGMAACAPQDPAQAAKEIERAVTTLGMRAVVINSHTQGEYLSGRSSRRRKRSTPPSTSTRRRRRAT